MGFIGALLVLALVLGVPAVAFIALAREAALRTRVEALERRLDALSSRRRMGVAAPEGASAPGWAAAPGVAQDDEVQAAAAATIPEPSAASPTVAAATSTRASRSWPLRDARAQAAPAGERDFSARAMQWLRRWFTEGNVPVKVGMAVLFAGVGALLKYAADQGWMRLPIGLRLLGIAAVALGGLAFGWRQRHLRRTFALSLQGGAIGVLLMTAFAAYKLYGLLDPLAAFVIWVVLAAAAGLLAVWQEERALAVLGILAGFLAPVLMATGSGNHVVLFSFYAILNGAIFAVAWLRSWRELNLLGFAFTFGIGTVWGVLHYTPEKLSTTLPFLLLFFVFYLLIPLLHARRATTAQRDQLEAVLVFGTPLVAFAQLAALLEGDRYPLAATALALGALHGVLAWRQVVARTPLLHGAYAVLGVGFATLAVPLALSAEATASVLALEGAGLVWFGLVQHRWLSRAAGTLLQGLASVALLSSFDGADAVSSQPVANAASMGTLLLAVAGFASAWCHHRVGLRHGALAWYLWALAWWLVMGSREISHFVPAAHEADAFLGFAALSALLAGLALRAVGSAALGWTIALALATALPLALWQSGLHVHPLAGLGWAPWLAYVLAGALALAAMRAQHRHLAAAAQGAWWLALGHAAGAWLSASAAGAGLESGWRHAARVLPYVLLGGALQWLSRAVGWPLQGRFAEWRGTLQLFVLGLLGVLSLGLLLAPADAAPLPWIPLLNPVELSLAAVLLLLAAWYFADSVPAPLRSVRAPLLAVALLLTLTSVTLRAVHHLGGVRWDLAMLLDSALAQASVSLVWSVLGVAGWVAGSRRRQRELWIVGATLMAVVLAKLVLVDRAHLGNLPGIASFIGYGLLCTLVGYLAPAPPRDALAARLA